MLVYLVRHAHSDPGDPDAARPLSERGRADAQALAERLAESPRPPRVVLSSPLLRARETAQAIAAATGAELRIDERLAPGADPERLRAAVEEVGAPGEEVPAGGAHGSGHPGGVGDEREPLVAVCHQPDCSQIARALTGSDPGFPPAGVAEIELAA